MSDQIQSQFKTVAVTGANGFIASQLIKSLLEKGFTVHCTVRSLDSVPKSSGHLLALDPKGEKLKFFEADLLKQGSFAACFEGVDGVFHTASPFQIFVEDPQRDLIDPAVKGTENVIREALNTPTVKRIVVTSSCAAIRHSDKPEGEILTDQDWNTTSTIESDPYPLSKVLAEKKAWELVEDKSLNTRNVRLTVICPSLVFGPPLSSRSDSTSVKILKSFLENAFTNGIPKVQIWCIDVRDVVNVHIHALLNDNAKGRYIVSSSKPIKRIELAQWVHEKYPHVQLNEAEGEYNKQYDVDNSRIINEFGIKLLPIKDSVIEMADALYALGITKKE